MGRSEPEDAALVTGVLAGDQGAFVAIYDRYGARVFDLCKAMLGPGDAPDATGEVFLVAGQRLGQLRDRERLGPWLFSIARHECFRRTERRRRTVPVGTGGDMTGLLDGAAGRVGGASDAAGVERGHLEAAELLAVVREASAGLEERDRLVVELLVRHGNETDDIADVLGVSRSTAHQVVHRARERLTRAMGAVLVARRGRRDCDTLAAILSDWDGQFTVLVRKRVARHIDDCEVCGTSRRALVEAFGGVAGAAIVVGALPFGAPPPEIRAGLVSAISAGTAAAAPPTSWRRDGFPVTARDRRATVALLAVLVAMLGAVVVVVVVAATGVDHRPPPSGPVPTTAATTTSAPLPAPTTAAVAATVGPATRPERPTTTAPTTTTGATSTTTSTTTTSTTSTTTSTPGRGTVPGGNGVPPIVVDPGRFSTTTTQPPIR